jgi:hypothetical protein
MVEAETGLVRGTAGALVHYRPVVSRSETRTQRLNRSRESEVWGNLVAQVGPPPASSQWIHVFDRGGDNYEAMCHLQQQKCDWIIRVAKLNRKVKLEEGGKMPLSEALDRAKVLGQYDLPLRSRPGQAARTAKIQVSILRVTLPMPKHHSPFVKRCGIGSITVNVLVVREVDAPKGVTPICWVLFTSLPVASLEEARQVIGFYECRWLIEEYHKVLKTGCSIESHALRTAERLEPLIALISVIGVRLLQLKTIAKREPATKAIYRVPSSWLNALHALRPRLSIDDLTVYQFFRELAKLGGFLARKHDGEPGWQTTWRGYQKLHLIAAGMELATRQMKKCV